MLPEVGESQVSIAFCRIDTSHPLFQENERDSCQLFCPLLLPLGSDALHEVTVICVTSLVAVSQDERRVGVLCEMAILLESLNVVECLCSNQPISPLQ